MSSIDGENLYGSIPVDEAIEEAIKHFEQDASKPLPLSSQQLRTLLQLATEEFFVYQGKLYIQVKGLSMGNSLAPILADLFMQKLEKNFTQKFKFYIGAYFRFVDDSFLLWHGTKKKYSEFLAYINQLHPQIKFTSEEEKNFKLNFLDLEINREPSKKFTTKIYRKQTAIFKPLHIQSLHHPLHKWSTLTSAVIRARKLTTLEKDLWTELRFIKEAFASQGYPELRIYQTITKALKKDIYNSTNKPNPILKDNIIIKSAPYIPQVSTVNTKIWNRTLKQNLIQRQVICTYKPHSNLFKLLSNPKQSNSNNQPDILKQSGVVYGVSCTKCPDPEKIHYVGETSRTLKERSYSHKYDKANKSALRDHTNTHPGHNDFNYKILAREQWAANRKIKESLLIRRLEPDWNSDRGAKPYCGEWQNFKTPPYPVT